MATAKVTVHPDYKIGDIDKRIYSGYLEHLGNLVYGGVYNPKHPSADELGLRRDFIDAIREAGFPAVRLPGGNIMSGWEWKDSIGPREQRKKHLDLSWRQMEPMDVGHDEYIEWAKRAGMESIYTVNMGTGSIQDAIHCVEYTNHPGGTYWSDLRKKNGFAEPHKVKTWCLGNEMDGPWQIHAWNKNIAGYAYKVNEASKAMKWVDPTIETVVCGSSMPQNHTYPDWDRIVLETCYEVVDYLSLHYYHPSILGNTAGFLNASGCFDEFLHGAISACDYVQAKLREPRKMMIAFDEFGVNPHRQGKTYTGRAGRLPAEVNIKFPNAPYREVDPDMPNRRAGGGMPRQGNAMLNVFGIVSPLMSFMRHADRVKIGCITFSFMNLISTDRDHVWRTESYYPYTHLLKYGQGVSLMPVVQSPTFNVEGYNIDEFHQCAPYENVPYIDAACAMNEEKEEVAIFLYNRNWEENLEVELDVRGFDGYKLLEHIEMYCDQDGVFNTYETPNAVAPSINEKTKFENGVVKLEAHKLSWNVIRLKK